MILGDSPFEEVRVPHGIRFAVVVLTCLLLLGSKLLAQQSDAMRYGVALTQSHRVIPNLFYLTVSGNEARLDVYASRSTQPAPVLVYFHGGGWRGGAKEVAVLNTMPYLMLGWTVVNVEYRLARNALAPAAVEDARCAVRFVLKHAKDFNGDTNRVVLSGHSAGGSLALLAVMLPVSAGLDRQCAGLNEIQVAAIVNWYGITDLADLLDGPNMQQYAVDWLGSVSDREAIARLVSPLTYVKAGVPPVLTVHGDSDSTAPYQHAVRLKTALDRVGVQNELVTIPGGEHGGFSAEEQRMAYTAIEAFLKRHGLLN